MRKNEFTRLVFLDDGTNPGVPLFKDMSVESVRYIDPGWEIAEFIRDACNEKEREKKEEKMKDCPDCEGSGYSTTYSQLKEGVFKIVWNHKAVWGNPEYAQITEWLCGRPTTSPFGHDSIDSYHAIRKIGDLAGLPKDWHVCKTCKGGGEIDE